MRRNTLLPTFKPERDSQKMGGGGSKTNPGTPDLNVKDSNVDSSFHVFEVHSPTMIMGSIGLILILGSAFILYRVYQAWLMKTRRAAVANSSPRRNAVVVYENDEEKGLAKSSRTGFD